MFVNDLEEIKQTMQVVQMLVRSKVFMLLYADDITFSVTELGLEPSSERLHNKKSSTLTTEAVTRKSILSENINIGNIYRYCNYSIY